MFKKRIWLEQIKNEFNNKKVLIMGLGLLGRGQAAAKFFCQLGAKVKVTDLRNEKELKPSLNLLKNYPIDYVLGRHRKKDFLEADIIIKNPAVPKNSFYLKIAKEHKIPVIMDESLFVRYAPVKVIGITGTRGKSTTSVLIYKILKSAGFSVWLTGNLPNKSLLFLLKRIKQRDWVVMELSSWQLQGFKQVHYSPHIALITNIYEDHLNYYPNMQSYLNDKKQIYRNQQKSDYLVLNKDQKISKVFQKEAISQVIWFSRSDFPTKWELKIRGEHNQCNVAAALKISEIFGIKQLLVKKTVEKFQSLPQRLEKICMIDGVEFINDSTSTTPEAGIAAIKSFEKPIILIAGGNSKNLNMEPLARLISKKVKKIIFLPGNETRKIRDLIIKYNAKEKIVGEYFPLLKAVRKAKEISQKGDVILFSPCCTSFASFKNEFDRGNQFRQAVFSLKKNGKKTI